MKLNKYDKRLMKFATHLYKLIEHPEQGLFSTVHLGAIENSDEDNEKIVIWYQMKYPGYIFDELVLIFPNEWEFSEFGNPILSHFKEGEETDMERSTIAEICIFFDLTLDELSIFDIEGYQQPERFGGKKLDFNSTVEDFAFNIVELIKSRNKWA